MVVYSGSVLGCTIMLSNKGKLSYLNLNLTAALYQIKIAQGQSIIVFISLYCSRSVGRSVARRSYTFIIVLENKVIVHCSSLFHSELRQLVKNINTIQNRVITFTLVDIKLWSLLGRFVVSVKYFSDTHGILYNYFIQYKCLNINNVKQFIGVVTL